MMKKTVKQVATAVGLLAITASSVGMGGIADTRCTQYRASGR